MGGHPDCGAVCRSDWGGEACARFCVDVFDRGSKRDELNVWPRNRERRWRPELQARAPGVPFFLVGLKKDLLEDENDDHVMPAEGAAAALGMMASGYSAGLVLCIVLFRR